MSTFNRGDVVRIKGGDATVLQQREDELADPSITVSHLQKTLAGMRALEQLTIRRRVIEKVYEALTGEKL